MKQHEKAEFAALITEVMGYYGKDASRFILNLWWSACENFELEQIQKALQAHMTDGAHGQYSPKVADLSRVLQGTTTDRAALAWGKTYEAMCSVGAYTDVVFDDPAIHAVVEDLGGWPKMCRTGLEEIGYLQHRFCVAHKAYTGRGEFEYPRRLGGDRQPDHEFERLGLPLPLAAMVGDRTRCQAVYQGGNMGGKTAVTFAAIDRIAANSPTLIGRVSA